MLRVDLAASAWLRRSMDDDTTRLVIELCTHIGMLMEDASVLALTLRQVVPDARAASIKQLITASEQIGYLLAGAAILQSCR